MSTQNFLKSLKFCRQAPRLMILYFLDDVSAFLYFFYTLLYFFIFFILLNRFALISRFATPDGRQNSYDFHGIWKSMNVSRILYFFYTLCDRCNTFAHGHPLRPPEFPGFGSNFQEWECHTDSICFYTLCDRCNTSAHGHPRREQRVERRDED